MPLCKKCGTQVAPGSKFCDNCGTPLEEEAVSPPPSPVTPLESRAPAEPPSSTPIPQIYIAVGIAIVVIIIAAVLASGVMSGSSKQVVTPTIKKVTTTSTPTLKTTVTPRRDPIIGVWRYIFKNSDGRVRDDRYRFYTDGTWAESMFWSSSPTDIWYDRGTWKNQGGNKYLVTNIFDSIEPLSFTYDPASNTIYDYRLSDQRFTTYQGDLAGV